MNAQVTLDLETFDQLREDAKAYWNLKNDISICAEFDYKEYRAELKRIDSDENIITDEEVEAAICKATRKIVVKIDKARIFKILFEDNERFKDIELKQVELI